jgi:homopolymeric O-antigen transport system permease protein
VTDAHQDAPPEGTDPAAGERRAVGRHEQVLDIAPRPDTRREWVAEVWAYRHVLDMLARKDFQTRYKRASLGVLWAVAVPLLQAGVMALIFSRVIQVASGKQFAVYVMSGVVAYSYFSTVVQAGATSIVDGAALTDKVWFPRVILVIVPALSNLIGFAVTTLVVLVAMPLFGVHMGVQLFLFIPAVLLLVAFTMGVSLVLGALDVYFRDVKFLVTAALMVWIYLSPIVYPRHFLGRLGPLIDVNPLTGVIALFHMATVGSEGPWAVSVAVSVVVTVVLLVAGAEAQRVHDRLFVDLL